MSVPRRKSSSELVPFPVLALNAAGSSTSSQRSRPRSTTTSTWSATRRPAPSTHRPFSRRPLQRRRRRRPTLSSGLPTRPLLAIPRRPRSKPNARECRPPADALTALPHYFFYWIVSAAYQAFMSRTGPSNPGSKPIPVGAPNCLMVGAADAASPISPPRRCSLTRTCTTHPHRA